MICLWWVINRIYYQSQMQTEKSQPKGERIMPQMRFTKFLALSIDPRVGISQSASETDVLFFSLSMTLEIIIYHLSFLSFFTFYIA